MKCPLSTDVRLRMKKATPLFFIVYLAYEDDNDLSTMVLIKFVFSLNTWVLD